MAALLTAPAEAQQPPALVATSGPGLTGIVATRVDLSGVARIREFLLLADDEARGVYVGRRAPNGSFDFSALVPLTGPGTEEFDIEALAVSGGQVWGIGSHSAVRASADGPKRTQAQNLERLRQTPTPRASRQVVFRMTLAADGTVSGEASSGLQSLLESDPVLRGFVGIAGKENGIDIEGLAADGDRLWVGFRGPVLRHGLTPVLEVTGFPSLRTVSVAYVQLGGRGVRDLLKTDDGFLVLAGPVGDSDQSSRLFRWDGRTCVPDRGTAGCTVTDLGEIRGTTGWRAEGMGVWDESSSEYRLLMVFDGVAGGDPTLVTVRK